MIRDPNNYITVNFTYEDEYESVTHLMKTVESDYMGETQLGVLCEVFKEFLTACGFSYLSDKKIEFVDAY